MTSQLPWPDTFLTAASWPAIRRLIDRCLELEGSNALPGTLMLVGETGLGREAVTVELASGLVCRAHTASRCDCTSCQRVRRGVHPDVEFIDVLPGKTLISIDQVRGFVDHASQLPYEGRRRVCVITSCHTPPLGSDAASALLKTLEEPPTHLTFILLASNPARVLPTIVSRSVQIRVPTPTEEELVALLEKIHGCKRERALELLAACDGEAGVAVQGGADLVGGDLPAHHDVLRKAITGDGLAILQAANAMAAQPGGVAFAAATLGHLAGVDPGGRAEGMIEAAIAMLQAERRSAALNLDLEGVVVGALAALATQHQG
ncbi:MAG: ATP-binding protein [Thermoanaerobaculales bacterium]